MSAATSRLRLPSRHNRKATGPGSEVRPSPSDTRAMPPATAVMAAPTRPPTEGCGRYTSVRRGVEVSIVVVLRGPGWGTPDYRQPFPSGATGLLDWRVLVALNAQLLSFSRSYRSGGIS